MAGEARVSRPTERSVLALFFPLFFPLLPSAWRSSKGCPGALTSPLPPRKDNSPWNCTCTPGGQVPLQCISRVTPTHPSGSFLSPALVMGPHLPVLSCIHSAGGAGVPAYQSLGYLAPNSLVHPSNRHLARPSVPPFSCLPISMATGGLPSTSAPQRGCSFSPRAEGIP